MKKLFLAVLCAGLFFACGNKKQAEPETLIDTPACQEMVEETPAVEEQEPVAEVQETNTASAKKTNTKPAAKTPSKAEQQGIQQVGENSNVKKHAEQAATNVANAAIDKAEKEATNSIVNSGKKKR